MARQERSFADLRIVRKRGTSFVYPVRPEPHQGRDRDAEGLRGLEVDRQLELDGLLDGQVSGLRALQYPVNLSGGAVKEISARFAP